MSTTHRPTDETTLEEVLAERNRLWAEVQSRKAQDRELEHWRSRALEMEGSLGWRATVLLRRLRHDPAGFVKAVVRRLRGTRSA